MRIEKKPEILNLTKLAQVIKLPVNNQVPVWLMRQAGRYLEEYREVRSTTNNFLEFCYNSEKAAIVTMQPINRFNFDAAIIFSDILVVPDALGVDVSFLINEGPKLAKTTEKNLNDLNFNKGKLLPVYEAIKKVRANLAPEKSLIGFVGAPWTLASYMVEGGSSKDFAAAKSWAYSDEKSFSRLIYILSDAITEHALAQIAAGADILQIFDSWAGVVASGREFEKWVIAPTRYIIDKIKHVYPNVPIIGFPRGAGVSYVDYVKNTNIDAVSVDYNMDLSWLAANIDITIQGNLDPLLLKNNNNEALLKAREILDLMRGRKFIFNLGHGIVPQTPIENVQNLVNLIRNYQ